MIGRVGSRFWRESGHLPGAFSLCLALSSLLAGSSLARCVEAPYRLVSLVSAPRPALPAHVYASQIGSTLHKNTTWPTITTFFPSNLSTPLLPLPLFVLHSTILPLPIDDDRFYIAPLIILPTPPHPPSPLRCLSLRS